MHPFYGPTSVLLESGSVSWTGLVSMALYLIFWGVVVVIALRLFKIYVRPPGSNHEDPALAILRQRYASGELSEIDFLHMKRILTDPDPPKPASGPGEARHGS